MFSVFTYTNERSTLYGSAAQVSAPVSVSVMVSAETDTAHSALVSVTAETSGFGRPLVRVRRTCNVTVITRNVTRNYA